jgi:hypothetical protein
MKRDSINFSEDCKTLFIGGHSLNINNAKQMDNWMFGVEGLHFRTKIHRMHGNRYSVEIAWFNTKGNMLRDVDFVGYKWLDYDES